MRILAILVLVVAFSCGKKSADVGTYQPAPLDGNFPSGSDTAKTYLALGDSYTIGQSVNENERFPAQTIAQLNLEGFKVSNPVYIAASGWTTEDLQRAIHARNPPSADIVSLLIGVNDQFRGMDTSGYATRFSHLLMEAVSLAKGKQTNVFVLSIPDYSATPFVSPEQKSTVSMQIDWFNAINKRIALAHGASYTDITPSTKEAANNPALVAGDYLHPSELEYKKWADMLAPKMKLALK